MTQLIPNRFLFDFEFPLRHLPEAPRLDGRLSSWSDRYLLPALDDLGGVERIGVIRGLPRFGQAPAAPVRSRELLARRQPASVRGPAGYADNETSISVLSAGVFAADRRRTAPGSADRRVRPFQPGPRARSGRAGVVDSRGCLGGSRRLHAGGPRSRGSAARFRPGGAPSHRLLLHPRGSRPRAAIPDRRRRSVLVRRSVHLGHRGIDAVGAGGLPSEWGGKIHFSGSAMPL
jgi:hypothetical protein